MEGRQAAIEAAKEFIEGFDELLREFYRKVPIQNSMALAIARMDKDGNRSDWSIPMATHEIDETNELVPIKNHVFIALVDTRIGIGEDLITILKV